MSSWLVSYMTGSRFNNFWENKVIEDLLIEAKVMKIIAVFEKKKIYIYCFLNGFLVPKPNDYTFKSDQMNV